MSDLIRRSDAIEFAKYTHIASLNEEERVAWIMNISAAEPKRGEWIEDGGIEKCNQCGERKEFPHWNFCPNCGARMKGADDETDRC